MSAIFGIIDLLDRPLQDEWIKSVETDLAHRGPDGQGLYREESVALGHMLLQVTPESIYDKSPYEEDGFVITANARLDERDALMDRLGVKGEERERITDPLLLLRSFRKFGKDFVKDIYGDFVFAIWDKKNKHLFCARDHIGVKPLLYYHQGGRFVFATELKAIVKLPFVKTEINYRLLRDQALNLWDQPCFTTWIDIFRLAPASIMNIDVSKFKITKYWQPKYKPGKEKKSTAQSAAVLRDLLHKIIADHTRGITKLGIPLSGGLDSGTIACIAARTMNNINKEIISVSSVLDQKFNHNDVADEMDFIQEILTHEKGIIPRYLYHTDQDFHKDLEIKFKRQFSVINSNHYIDDGIFKHLKSYGVRRMLTGVYGDFTATNRLINPYPRLLLTGRLFALIKLIESDRIHSGLSLYSIVKSNIVLPLLPFVLREILFRLKHTPIKWGSEELGLIPDEKERKEVQNRLMSDFRKHFLSDLNILHNIWPAYHEPFYEEWDCESAHYGIEITYPMADRRLIEFLLSLPVEHFMADGMKRGLIRKSMEGILPEKIRLRKGKITYSPGYHDILTKDKSKYLDTLNNISRESPLNMYVNLAYLSKRLESLLNRKNSIIFEGNYWNLINTYLWVSFCKAIDEGQFHNN